MLVHYRFALVLIWLSFSAVSWGEACGDPDLQTTRDYLDKKVAEIPARGSEQPMSLTWDESTNLLYLKIRYSDGTNTAWAPLDMLEFTYLIERRGVVLGCGSRSYGCDPEDGIPYCYSKDCWVHSMPLDEDNPHYWSDGFINAFSVPNKLYGDKIIKALEHLQCLSKEALSNSDEPF